MTSLLRFYVRNEDGSVEGDETVVVNRRTLDALEKDFRVLGRRKTMVIEFDPPLIVPSVAAGTEEGEG